MGHGLGLRPKDLPSYHRQSYEPPNPMSFSAAGAAGFYRLRLHPHPHRHDYLRVLESLWLGRNAESCCRGVLLVVAVVVVGGCMVRNAERSPKHPRASFCQSVGKRSAASFTQESPSSASRFSPRGRSSVVSGTYVARHEDTSPAWLPFLRVAVPLRQCTKRN